MEQENKSKSSSEKVDDKLSLSSSSSLKSSKKQKSSKAQLESEDISLSQLELMANKKKIKSIEDISIISKKSPTVKRQQEEDFLKKSVKSSKSSSSSSSSSDDSKQKRRKEKLVSRENQNDAIRKEKSEFLYKFNKLNVKGKWSSLRLDMNCTLDEIRNEFERIKSEISSERNVAFFKRMLLLGVQGIEMLNTKFDPVGVDLDGWSEAMGYSMENQEYDEVMAELYEKYKGRGQMSPELRFIFMIFSSATMFTISKKISKLDTNSAITSLLGGLMNKAPTQQTNNQQTNNQQTNNQQQQQQYQQQQYQQQQQQYQQQMYNQQQQQQYQQRQQTNIQPNIQANFFQRASESVIPNASDLRNQTETSEDALPSKMNAPNTNYISPDGIDIDNILKTMNERKKEKEISKKEITETSDDIFKNIPINMQKKRGRPKKGNVMKM
jgi:uncharacterized cupredoxin-like copper-binding protein